MASNSVTLRSTKRSSKISPAADSSPSSATPSWSAEPTLIHDAHLVMSLECKGLLIWILSERPSAAAVGFGADGVVVQVSRSDHPGRAFA